MKKLEDRTCLSKHKEGNFKKTQIIFLGVKNYDIPTSYML